MKISWGPLAPRGRLSHLTAGSPRVMPAYTQPSPACPRSSAPRGPRRGITMQSAFPTRSQKSSGALPARRAGIARGHPAGAMVRGSEACLCLFSRSDFRTIAEGACRTSLSSAQILSPGAQRGFQRGAPFDTFLLAFGVYQKRVVVRGRNPAGHAPGGGAEAGARQCATALPEAGRPGANQSAQAQAGPVVLQCTKHSARSCTAKCKTPPPWGKHIKKQPGSHPASQLRPPRLTP